jgi:hypothetical protein
MSDQESDDNQRRTKKPADDDQYSDEETMRRRDAVIKRMLDTPAQPPKAKERPATKGRVHKGKSRS